MSDVSRLPAAPDLVAAGTPFAAIAAIPAIQATARHATQTPATQGRSKTPA